MINIKLNRINLLSRVTLSFVFIYHGLIPKILFLDELEVVMITTPVIENRSLSPPS